MTKERSLLNVRFACIPTQPMYEQPAAGSFLFGGEPENAQEHFEVARRVNPVDPRTFFTQTAMASELLPEKVR